MNSPIKNRKVRRLVIEEASPGDWRIRLYFSKNQFVTLPHTWDNHTTACISASGLTLKHNLKFKEV